MAIKNISITEDAYERLKKLRHHGESFSEIIVHLTNKRNLLEVAGILSAKAARELEGRVQEFRKRWNRDQKGRVRSITKQLR